MGRKKRRPAKSRPPIIIIVMLGCCVCVWERERERQGGRERERARERIIDGFVAVDALEKNKNNFNCFPTSGSGPQCNL